ncbi:MAG: DUF3500 domain-containing protein [Verrucomicrobia bacterium]|nr:DUF3500 domain-containing protein [Verrucomicrobiota bacterium]
MAEAAQRLVASLSVEQRAQATFDMGDPARRDWHFVPRDRRGLPVKAMSPAQRQLAHGLLASGLSHRGYLKATTIMSLEAVLQDLEQGRGPVRDPELYYFSVFGVPSAKGTWGWRVEGHHLSLSFTVVAGVPAAVTPSFLGSNPGEVRAGSRAGLRVLQREEDLARELVKSLDSRQRQVAVFSDRAPSDIVTGPNRAAGRLEPAGLAAAQMTAGQQALLVALMEEYVLRHRPELVRSEWERIRAVARDQLYFAWAGGFELGQGHYYRVQGPTFIFEYDNTQNGANHIHTVWRDSANDFGDDPLRRHYEQVAHPR